MPSPMSSSPQLVAPSPDDADRFRLKRWTAEFAAPTMERAYRRETFRENWRANRLVFLIAAAGYLLHCGTDYWHYGFGPTFLLLAGQKLILAAVMIVAFPLVGGPNRIARTDLVVFGLSALVAVSYCGLAAQMPQQHLTERGTIQSVTALLILIAQYVFTVNRLPLCVAAGLVTSLSYLALNLATGRLQPGAMVIETFLHVAVHALGIVFLYRDGLSRRRAFALRKQQDQLNRRLEAQGRSLEQAAMQLERARDDALHANRAKSEFLAYMAHELRSPLNAIIGFSEMMKREVFGRIAPPKYRDYAEDIHASGSHLLAVINDLLDLSKAESGRMELAESAVDVGAVVDSVRRLVAMRAEASRIAIQVPAGDKLPALLADSRMVKQMVLNLLTNAIKFTPPGGKVAIGATVDAQGAMRLSVADTGPGIAAADLPRILEPYGRAQRPDLQNAESTGLGLPLVKRMIEAHGGALEIDSAVGKGSIFTLRFPPARTLPGGSAAAAAA